MKVTVYLNGVYISTKRTNGFDKDNRPVINEYVAMECNEEVGNIKCSTGVFNAIKDEPKYSEMTFQGVLDTWNKDIVISGYKLKEKQEKQEKQEK